MNKIIYSIIGMINDNIIITAKAINIPMTILCFDLYGKKLYPNCLPIKLVNNNNII
jgi:hypothetical protein